MQELNLSKGLVPFVSAEQRAYNLRFTIARPLWSCPSTSFDQVLKQVNEELEARGLPSLALGEQEEWYEANATHHAWRHRQVRD